MCDNSLDDKADALLSRISKLENAVAVGAVMPRPSVQSVPKKNDEALHDGKNAESNAIVVESVDATKDISSNPNLKALRGWNEVVEQAAAGDASLLGFLKVAKAFTDGSGGVFIRFPNPFAMQMSVSKESVKADIRAALCILLKIQLSEDDIHYGIFEGNENELEELDELNI